MIMPVEPTKVIRDSLAVPDARSPSVRERLATQVAALDPDVEAEALRWIEAVSEFDERDEPAGDSPL